MVENLNWRGFCAQSEAVNRFLFAGALLMTTTDPKHYLGHYDTDVKNALAEMSADRIMARIWEHDHTVWKPDPKEITNRLGWLTIASELKSGLGEIAALVKEVRAAGYT